MSVNHWRISRRTTLRCLGVSVALPLLDVMESIGAQRIAQNRAVRACYLYIPNGIADGAWGAEDVGPNGGLRKLNKCMVAFEQHKSDIIIPRNMWTPRGNGHGAGTATWLTGHGYDGRKVDAGGASEGQLAARHIGKQTLLPSLELSLQGEGFFSIVWPEILFLGQQPPRPWDETRSHG